MIFIMLYFCIEISKKNLVSKISTNVLLQCLSPKYFVHLSDSNSVYFYLIACHYNLKLFKGKY